MGKKPASVRPKSSLTPREDTSPKMYGMSAGHLIADRVHMLARCGKPLSTWFFGTLDEVRCSPCKEAVTA